MTDDPPAEIALAGHDRCIIRIKPESINAWLNPDFGDLAAQYAILDDRHNSYTSTTCCLTGRCLRVIQIVKGAAYPEDREEVC